MDDNLLPAQATAFALPGASVLALHGADAVKFAQAQFMSDVASLADGQWQWSGWLTPKGRLVAFFALLRFDAQTLWLLLPDADADGLREALQRYVFRSKVVLEARRDLRVSGAFSPPAIARAAQLSTAGDGTVEVDLGTPETARVVHIGARSMPADAGKAAEWMAFDLLHGLPRLDVAQSGHWTPQQLSLDRLRAYSVKKGCYPGQEIVARTHFLGQAKRGLRLFDSDASVDTGSDVLDGEQVVGTIVSRVAVDTGSVLLAVLPLEHSMHGLTAAGAPLRAQPLQEGLAR
jgi:folate-binding protein YgfZ